ncbi:Uncharacterised protein [Streptococcus criceti]|uniref:Lipoprotein n=1 Tax=Streptococcus criceti HS-6 TaxID=873449 RepID=G5JNA3_STRCG|nr:hypothetical protein [Streptococcus criceti]EHI73743.1 putative lipoprotein [Streptococcus criceti HS-6]SUN41652.1 Uncharacterised protein [Streptococcus criceti]
MKKYIVICMVLCTFLLAACQAKSPKNSSKPKQSETVRLEKAKTLEVGITYKLGDDFNDLNTFYVKLTDDKHYVYMIDHSHYTQDELDEINADEDSVDYYPVIHFTEGEYTREGENITLTPKKRVITEFKDPQHVKDKIIASKRLSDKDKAGRTLTIVKEDGGYVENNQGNSLSLYKIAKKLPNSIDDFLAQYDYQPEELE